MNYSPSCAAELEATVWALRPNGGVVEVRAFGCLRNKKGVVSGFYDDYRKLAQDVARLDAGNAGRPNKPEAIYLTLNPILPELLARRSNRLEDFAENLTADSHVTRRAWLFVDCDPVRLKGISATDAEKQAAKARAVAVREHLRGTGWPAPLCADSGNGFHLLYAIDLPSDGPAKILVENCLKALAARFDDDVVTIDTAVFNGSRVIKFHGTMARKGDATTDRPHRKSCLLPPLPTPLVLVSRELLDTLAYEVPPPPLLPARAVRGVGASPAYDTGPYDMEGFIAKHGIEASAGIPYQGGTKWQIDCPFNPDHQKPDAALYVTASGAAAFKCSHASCQGKDWHQLRVFYGDLPTVRDTPRYEVERPRGVSVSPASVAALGATGGTGLISHRPLCLDPRALYGIVGHLVSTLDPHTESDQAAIVMQSLTAAGSLFGRTAFYRVESDRHHTNLYIVLCGQSAKGRKGTSWGHTRTLFADVEPGWATNQVKSGLASGEGLIYAVRDDEQVTDKRLCVVEPEFANVLRVGEREGNTVSARLRDAWDTGKLATLTKNNPLIATDAHISVIGHITNDELLRLLNRTETANGFANRFLWVSVRRSKLLPDGGDFLNDPARPGLVQAFSDAAEFARNVRQVTRTPEARAMWHAVYPVLSADTPGLLGAVTSRAEAQVTRLSLIYALLDQSAVITADHLTAALAVWEYCKQSARFIFGDALGDPDADALLKKLREAGDKGLTRTEISTLLFGKHAKSAQIDRALELLDRVGYAFSVTEPSDGGRPVERWYALSRDTERE